jgi:beta-glucosidase/6-phospho-beta-glucosidase/beta-galactosidase
MKQEFGPDFKWGVSTAAYQFKGHLILTVKVYQYGMFLQTQRARLTMVRQAT